MIQNNIITIIIIDNLVNQLSYQLVIRYHVFVSQYH